MLNISLTNHVNVHEKNYLPAHEISPQEFQCTTKENERRQEQHERESEAKQGAPARPSCSLIRIEKPVWSRKLFGMTDYRKN
jgi:hypothetical protein